MIVLERSPFVSRFTLLREKSQFWRWAVSCFGNWVNPRSASTPQSCRTEARVCFVDLQQACANRLHRYRASRRSCECGISAKGDIGRSVTGLKIPSAQWRCFVLGRWVHRAKPARCSIYSEQMRLAWFRGVCWGNGLQARLLKTWTFGSSDLFCGLGSRVR